jgi:hypothetical protein
METPRIENGEYEHHGRTRRQGTQDEPPRRRMRLSIDTVDRCCNCTRQSTCRTNGCDCFRAGRRCENCLCIDQCCNQFLNSQLTIECSGTEDSVGSHRVRDSTNANEENILRIENLPTGEGNGGEGTPVSPSTHLTDGPHLMHRNIFSKYHLCNVTKTKRNILILSQCNFYLRHICNVIKPHVEPDNL